MNTISYNIENYYKEELFGKIDKLCNKPYDLFVDFQLFILDIKIKKQIKQVQKINLELVNSIDEIGFEDLISFESRAEKILKSLYGQVHHRSKCENSVCRNKQINLYTRPLIDSFENLLKTIKSTYHLNPNTFFQNEDDLKSNNKALEVFADLWDSDDFQNEDKEFIFNLNKK